MRLEGGVRDRHYMEVSSRPWTLHPNPQTLNPKPWTPNPEPLTLNPKSWTLDPKSCALSTLKSISDWSRQSW